MIKRIMNILFLSCMKATELLEKKLHFSLSKKEKYQLKMHKAMCDACRRYDRQNIFIDESLKHQDYISQNVIDVEQLKKQIKEKMSN